MWDVHVMNSKIVIIFPSLVLGQAMHQDKHYTHIFCLTSPTSWILHNKGKKSWTWCCHVEQRSIQEHKHKNMWLNFFKVPSKTSCLNPPSTFFISIVNCSSSIQSLHTNLLDQHTKLNNKLKTKASSKQWHPLC